MKITKFVHSCLLVEDSGRVGLIDPGRFSWESELFDVTGLDRLNDVVITHEHFDHFHLPFVQALVGRFPDVRIVTTGAVAEQLKAVGIMVAAEVDGVERISTPHEALEPLGVAPEHVGVHYLGKLTHPGDSHHFTEAREILALPVTAPWGSMIAAAGLALRLKPKYIVPIHDWHWNDVARNAAYDMLAEFFAGHSIEFLKPRDGVAIDVG